MSLIISAVLVSTLLETILTENSLKSCTPRDKVTISVKTCKLEFYSIGAQFDQEYFYSCNVIVSTQLLYTLLHIQLLQLLLVLMKVL